MQKTFWRRDGNEFCRLELEVRGGLGNQDRYLSICGTAGYIITPAQARKEAIQHWESYFEEDANYLKEMNKRCGTNFRSNLSAAKYVTQVDGQYHGLDVVREDDKEVFVCHSCGQIREEIGEYFPEVVHFFQHHLKPITPEVLDWFNAVDFWGTF